MPQIWLDAMIEEWTQKLANGLPVPPVHAYMGMTESMYSRVQNQRPKYAAGSDEVGYGAIAGPLVVCAVRASLEWNLKGLRDSKTLSMKQINEMYLKLHDEQQAGRILIAVVEVRAPRIDELGAVTALRKAHAAALNQVSGKNALLIVDGNVDMPMECMNMPKADTFIPQVMAASILAKHLRDNFMQDMDPHYPGYGFANHMGYGTEGHMAAIKEKGLCPLHRRSCKPCKGEGARE